MISKAEILKEIFLEKEYENICRRICGGDQRHRDLFQELYLILYSKEESKLQGLYERKQIKWFIIKILKTEWQLWERKRKSNPSKFNQLHRKIGEDFCISEVPNLFVDIQEEVGNEIIETELGKDLFVDKNDWYTTNLVRAYIKAGTMRKLSKETGIRTPSICYTVKNFKERIKEKQTEYRNFMQTYNPKITISDDKKREIFIAAQKENMAPEKYIEKIINEKQIGKS